MDLRDLDDGFRLCHMDHLDFDNGPGLLHADVRSLDDGFRLLFLYYLMFDGGPLLLHTKF
jgi:hypothetical protein